MKMTALISLLIPICAFSLDAQPFTETNWALTGPATQSSTGVGGEAEHAIDGNTDGLFANGSVTLNETADDEGWWEVDLGATRPIGRLHIWFRILTADECQALFNACAVRNDDFTLSILDENRSMLWRRTYPGRPPSHVPYNLPAPVNGRFVRFERQNPLTTSDGFFSLAEVQVIAPYTNATVTVTQNPTNVTVLENRSATLGPVAATVSGAPADVLQYQWQRNDVDIIGANTAIYKTPLLTLSDNGTKYRANFLLSGSSVSSAEATVTVLADTVAPTIQSVVGGASYTEVTVVYSEPVTSATAGAVTNYALSGGLAISEVTVLTPTSVRLITSRQTPGASYTLTVNNVRDLAQGPGNPITPNSTKNFVAPLSERDKFVRVGDAGNAPDPVTGRGRVNYTYLISKYELSNGEYAGFLNAKGASDPHALWRVEMDIARNGEEGSYTYTVNEGFEKHPVRFVSAVDGMRYVNWLNNGATASSDTETGAYTFTDESTFGARNPEATFLLPNENEWYKAAYYDPTKGGSGGYWVFPMKTDGPIVAELPPGGANSGNFNNVNAGQGDTTDVGAYTAATSYYGTFDQAGNLWEWNEPLAGATRTRRTGGSWGNADARLRADVNADNPVNADGETTNQGVRIAKADRVVLEFVTVGNPGNPADPVTGRGQVNYVYQIGKTEVRNADYAIFLNATAATDSNALWRAEMDITRNGAEGSYTYTVNDGFENRPVRFVSALDAMRFANWLQNGGRADSDTETGSYTFTGPATVGPRNPAARFVLPDENEWYKAAYYDPAKGGSGYWVFPMRTDGPLVSGLPPGGATSGNFDNVNAADGGTTDVGAYTAAASFYGTYDMAGNLWEWNEPLPGAIRTRRTGGSWGNAEARLRADVNADNPIDAGGETTNQGFRLAQVAPQAARPRLAIKRSGSNEIEVSWVGGGKLQSSSSIAGIWVEVPGASPQTIPITGAARFFRVQQ